MVLLVVSIITKNGKQLVARQFVNEMTKSRLEGLLAAFPQLVSTDLSQRQHTFVETDSVRYVYQSHDDVYVVLVTTKASNILEDLVALRLFSNVILDCCKSYDEVDILKKAFELIFAFDEIVALGYRENVTLAMIRTYVDMDSQEERTHNQIVNSQIRDTTKKAQQRAKELAKQRAQELKKIRERNMAGGGYGLNSNNAHKFSSTESALNSSTSSYMPKTPDVSVASSKGGGKALKLGAKKVSDDAFMKQLESENQFNADF